MDDILGNLGLYKKPVPKEKTSIKVAIPQVLEDITVNITIIDKTREPFDRDAIMARINKSQPMQKIPEEEEILQEKSKPRVSKSKPRVDKTPTDVDDSDVVMVVKRKGKSRLKIGKSLKKTITGYTAEEKSPPVIKVKKGHKVKVRTLTDVPSSKIVIGDTLLSERLWPKQEDINIRAASYYMNNRKIFINFIDALFQKYREDLEEEGKDLSCDRSVGAFSLMTHQSIVRDYINLYTPYRGLLIYHGLGAGKTCSSISMAEGMKSDKGIVVMTPASLRQNYITELKTCGDTLYRLNQYWEFISTEVDPDL